VKEKEETMKRRTGREGKEDEVEEWRRKKE
jgi:hypothetical protein